MSKPLTLSERAKLDRIRRADGPLEARPNPYDASTEVPAVILFCVGVLILSALVGGIALIFRGSM